MFDIDILFFHFTLTHSHKFTHTRARMHTHKINIEACTGWSAAIEVNQLHLEDRYSDMDLNNK